MCERCVTKPVPSLFSLIGMPDSELIARARTGDRDALDALVARHYDDCWRYALRLLGERADAEDAVQETFMRAIAALPHYQEHQRFRGWLFTILVNQCRNAAIARRRRLQRFSLLGSEVAAGPHSAITPAPIADDALAHALAQLDPLQREAVLLKLGEGMGYAELSQVTGASESALKMRVKRGCERLRTLLRPVRP